MLQDRSESDNNYLCCLSVLLFPLIPLIHLILLIPLVHLALLILLVQFVLLIPLVLEVREVQYLPFHLVLLVLQQSHMSFYIIDHFKALMSCHC